MRDPQPPAAPGSPEGSAWARAVAALLAVTGAAPADDDASAADARALVREVGCDPDILEVTARAARTRSFAELVALLHEVSAGALPRDGPITPLVDAVTGLFSSTPAHTRAAWTALSLPTSSFTLGQAESMLGAAAVAEPEGALADLVTAGIVERQEEAGVLRFRVRALHRIPARRRLEADRAAFVAVRSALLAWWSEAARAFSTGWFAPDQPERFDRLEREVLVLELLLDTSGPEDGGVLLEIVASLWPLWTARNRVERAIDWMVVARTRGRPGRRESFEANWAIAWLALCANDGATADAAIAAAVPDDPGQGVRLDQLRGIRALYADEPRVALGILRRTLLHHERLGRPGDVFIDLSYSAASAWAAGDQELAAELCSRAVQHSDRLGDRWMRTYVLWVAALVAWRGDRGRAAFDLAVEGVRSAAEAGDQHAAALCLEILAWCEAFDGSARNAARLFGVTTMLEGVVGVPTLFWNTQPAHAAAVLAATESIGAQEFELRLREGRLRGVHEAIAWLEAGPSVEGVVAVAATRSLTPRQLEIAMLIADGRTNKEIAHRLLITVRAVEAHVERIFARLGYVSRSQVAAWVARRPGLAVTAADPASQIDEHSRRPRA